VARVTADSDQPDPQYSVPRVSFGSSEAEPETSPDEIQQTDAERELQEENAETSLDQPSS
jgi:hypothetical protein